MNAPFRPFSDPALAATEPSESLDVRLIVAGRLSPASVQLRHERAALAAVLARTDDGGTGPSTEPQDRAR